MEAVLFGTGSERNLFFNVADGVKGCRLVSALTLPRKVRWAENPDGSRPSRWVVSGPPRPIAPTPRDGAGMTPDCRPKGTVIPILSPPDVDDCGVRPRNHLTGMHSMTRRIRQTTSTEDHVIPRT